jgi:DNA alkylation repair enzyme
MPSIDLGRLRKQASRLTDFFFVPDEFTRQLNAVLDSYVNYTRRKSPAVAPEIKLPTHRTPSVVLKQIELELAPLATAMENSRAALALADRLWEEGSLETRLLAGFILGRLPPQEDELVARLAAWIAQSRDGSLRNRLLDQGLMRMRKEARADFLGLLDKWLQPENSRHWGDAIRAAIAAVRDPAFSGLPPLLKALEPALQACPAQLQLDLEELIATLYAVSPSETVYYVRQILAQSANPSTPAHFRRMAPSLPAEVQSTIRELSGRARPSPD